VTGRLAADLWVAAYRARLEAAGAAVYVAAKGDPTAGAVLVKHAPMDGTATLWGRVADAEGTRVWAVIAEGAEQAVDDAIARQRRYDPDLWVIEVEDRRGGPRLDEPGFA
jgi:hypothetical protein